MRISISREIAPLEDRVILRPQEVSEIVRSGHSVCVEKGAGGSVHLTDEAYEEAGATIMEDRLALFRDTDVLVKLKAPTPEEFGFLQGNILFSMLHHRQNPANVYHLGRSRSVAVEMESIKNRAGERIIDGTDMTGECGVLYAIRHMKKVPAEVNVLVLGYGRVGSSAIRTCNMLGMHVKILRKEEFADIRHFLTGRDLVINAIAWPAEQRAAQRYLVTREMLSLLNPGAVILDLSVDFPSPIETCRPTSLSNPWYLEDGIVHVAIYGYPGLAPISSTARYSRQILPAILLIAHNDGLSGIEREGELGLAISKAIVDPCDFDWQEAAPPEPAVGSLIE